MQRYQDLQALRLTDYAATSECSTPCHFSLPQRTPSLLLYSRQGHRPASLPLLLAHVLNHTSFCKLTHPAAISDEQVWWQEPQAAALWELEAAAPYPQHQAYAASPYEATLSPGPGFNPNLSEQSPNADALVDSFSSIHPQDTPSDSNQVELTTNNSIAPALSTLSASVPQQGSPARAGRNRFECEDCHKTFDRASRLNNCRNRHLGIKPWQCGGRCQDPTCDAKYACIDYLRRHLLSNNERRGQCSKCHQNLSKQNMARHKASCV